MGKPFLLEMQQVEKTYEFASQINIELLKKHITDNLDFPFLVVGSGGSFSVAQVGAMSINYLGGVAQAITPYELMEFSNGLKMVNVIFFTAGGGNPDIINAYNLCKQAEVKSTFIICLSKGSKIIEIANKKYKDSCFLEVSVPCGHDGFLAVNSTICATTILKQVIDLSPLSLHFTDLPCNILECIQTDSIIALGGRWTLPAVYDFESKCSEAGLINVMPADFRNFAHGRHHWIAKNPNTAVLCFVSPNEYNLARKTLEILPGETKKCILYTEKKGINATLDSLLYVFQIVQQLGVLKEIDPGRPGVPFFGSQLYRLNHHLIAEAQANGLIRNDIVYRMAIRKNCVRYNAQFDETLFAAKKYLIELTQTYFTGIIFDYDNTIISHNDTNSVVFQSCINYITSFLENGIGICFATGRGKSIREQLLDIFPSSLVGRIYIAYYNGAFVQPLNAEIGPTDNNIDEAIQNVFELVSKECKDSELISSLRNSSLSYQGCKQQLDSIYYYLSSAILRSEISGIKVLRSDHSIDIIPQRVSKKLAYEYMIKQYSDSILCIGDSGSENGNDYELLNTKFSLSVDKVSSSLLNCWNIASLGVSGPWATQEYLSKLQITKKGLHFKKTYLREK